MVSVSESFYDYENAISGNDRVVADIENVFKSMGILVHRTHREVQRWGVERILEFRDDLGNLIGFESTDIQIDWMAQRSQRYFFEMDMMTVDGAEVAGWFKRCIAQKVVIVVPQERFFCRVDMTELRSFCDLSPNKEKTGWIKTRMGYEARGLVVPRQALPKMNSYWEAQWR